MESGNFAVEFKTDTRTSTFDNPATQRNEQCFDARPFEGDSSRFGKDDLLGFGVFGIHMTTRYQKTIAIRSTTNFAGVTFTLKPRTPNIVGRNA